MVGLGCKGDATGATHRVCVTVIKFNNADAEQLDLASDIVITFYDMARTIIGEPEPDPIGGARTTREVRPLGCKAFCRLRFCPAGADHNQHGADGWFVTKVVHEHNHGPTRVPKVKRLLTDTEATAFKDEIEQDGATTAAIARRESRLSNTELDTKTLTNRLSKLRAKEHGATDAVAGIFDAVQGDPEAFLLGEWRTPRTNAPIYLAVVPGFTTGGDRAPVYRVPNAWIDSIGGVQSEGTWSIFLGAEEDAAVPHSWVPIPDGVVAGCLLKHLFIGRVPSVCRAARCLRVLSVDGVQKLLSSVRRGTAISQCAPSRSRPRRREADDVCPAR